MTNEQYIRMCHLLEDIQEHVCDAHAHTDKLHYEKPLTIQEYDGIDSHLAVIEEQIAGLIKEINLLKKEPVCQVTNPNPNDWVGLHDFMQIFADVEATAKKRKEVKKVEPPVQVDRMNALEDLLTSFAKNGLDYEDNESEAEFELWYTTHQQLTKRACKLLFAGKGV